MNPASHENIIQRMVKRFGSGHFQAEIDLHSECVRLHKEIDKLKAEKKEMLVLLSKVYMDIDQTNGSLYWDTVREIKKWVNKS